MSVHCCVIWVKVGGERKAERASGFSHVLRLWRASCVPGAVKATGRGQRGEHDQHLFPREVCSLMAERGGVRGVR